MPFFRKTLVAAFALILVAVFAATAEACPSCGSAMSESGEAGRKMVGGWFWSILFMMSMPFAILGSLGGYMYYLVRKARAAAANGNASVASAEAIQPAGRPTRFSIEGD